MLLVPLATGDAWVPKVRAPGFTVTEFTPLPVSAALTVVAVFCVKLIARFSGFRPVVVGRKATPIVQLVPAARFFG